MKHFYIKYSCLVICLIFISCNKVIKLHLKKVDPKLVIEAVVSNGFSGTYVKITHTVAFADTGYFPNIENAKVFIRDSNEQYTDTLQLARSLAGESIYKAYRLKAKTGHVYQLSVQIADEIYTARSAMPDSVAFDGIVLLSDVGPLDSGSVFTVVPKFTDQKGVPNYYQFIQYVNFKRDRGINVLNDNIGDGLPNERPIFTRDIDIKIGDTLRVVMLNIDQHVYQYFYQLAQNQDGIGVTPGNPVSNISNGALGYFSAQYEQTRQAIINKEDEQEVE